PSMFDPDKFLDEHRRLTRRFFLDLSAGALASSIWPGTSRGEELSPECARACAEALKRLEYLTHPDKFGDVSRGNPVPHKLPEAKRREVGLVPETWRLEVVADPGTNAEVENPLSKEKGTALDWAALMKLGEKHATSFARIMTCNNIGRPL